VKERIEQRARQRTQPAPERLAVQRESSRERLRSMQRAKGNAAVGRLLGKPARPASGGLRVYRLKVGDQLPAELLAAGRALARSPVVNDAAIEHVCRKAAPFSDSSRLFVAGLREPANLQLLRAGALEEGAEFDWAVGPQQSRRRAAVARQIDERRRNRSEDDEQRHPAERTLARTPAKAAGLILMRDDKAYQQHKFCRPGTAPNDKVPEDEATCTDLLAKADAALGRQRTRAAGMVSGKTVNDYRYWFAKVYSFVTENEIAFVKRRAYYYPSYVLRSVLYFEQIFDDNVRAADRGAAPEPHWKAAFDSMATCKKNVDNAVWAMNHPQVNPQDPTGGASTLAGLGLNVITQSILNSAKALTEGMKAHIRYDLPRAEAWVVNKYYSGISGVGIGDFKTDFMSMAGVFDNAGASMQKDMADKLSVPVDKTPSIMQDTTMTYWFDADMATERADTWRRAEIILPTAGTGPYPTMGATGPAGGDTTTGDNVKVLDAIAGELRPSMSDSAYKLSADDAGTIRDKIKSLGPEGLKKTGAVERVRWIRRLIRGAVFDRDREAVVSVLSASKDVGELVIVIDAADAYDIMRSFGSLDSLAFSRTSLDGQFMRGYYSGTATVTAIRLIEKCIVGETSNWEKSIVANILEVRGDVKEIVTEIGRKHPDSKYDDLNAGVAAIRWAMKTLTGGYGDRVIAAFRKAGIPTDAQPK
jgi:hypothetical protein